MKRVAALAMLVMASRCELAHADQPLDRPEAFEVDRDRPPPGQAELGFDAGGSIGGTDGQYGGQWAASVMVGYLDRPFSLETRQAKRWPVDHRETFILGGAYAVTPTVLVDARLPLIHQVGTRYVGFGDDRPLDRFTIGDFAVGGRLRLAQRDHAQLFVRGELTLPSGDDHDFSGEARYTANWNLIARFSLPEHIMIAATAGVRLRPREVQIADVLLSDELDFGVGASYELPVFCSLYCEANHVRVTGELVGVLGNDVANKRGPSPVEMRYGLVSEVRSYLAIAGRVGIGLDQEIGSPRFRGLVEVVYRH